MEFSNQASLVFNGVTRTSNTVSGTITAPLSLSKSASATSYAPGGRLAYTITLINRSAQSFAGLSLLDDLGQYNWEGFARFPMAYEDGTALLTLYSAGGVATGDVTAQSTAQGITFTFDMPALTLAILRYEVFTTSFAPPAAGSVITNTATLDGDATFLPLNAQATLPVIQGARLGLTKNYYQNAGSGQTVSYVFTIANSGNVPTLSTDFVTLSDLFNPPLTGISVTANGVLWAEGTQYQYDESAAYFQTLQGAITLDAAAFSQDSFGRWNTTPASMIITVTGTLSAPTVSS